MNKKMIKAYELMYEAIQKIPKNSKPYFTKEEEKNMYPELEILECNWEEIKKESQKAKSVQFGSVDKNQFKDVNWLVHFLIYMRNETNHAENSPNTMHLLRNLKSKGLDIRNAFFSTLAPHSHLDPHVGPQSSVLRYHLGLVCPPNCWLEIENKIYRWEEGKGFLWNDMFLHSAHNTSDKFRTVLFLDIGRKDLTEDEKKIDEECIKKVCDTEEFKEFLEKFGT
jgi:beta-hydroxylase